MEKQKTYYKRLTLGRLESSSEFKEKRTKKLKPIKDKEFEIEKLKITVRDLNLQDKQNRQLNKNLKGSVILEISNRSPLSGLLEVNDIILEVQKKPINSSSNLNNIVNETIKQKNTTLLLTVINRSNQRRYLGVKIK